MKLTYIIAAAAGLAASSARADVTAGYSLSAGSSMVRQWCLDPCDCPYHADKGPLSGSYTLALKTPAGIVNTEYSVTGLSFIAEIEGKLTTIQGYGTYLVGSTYPFQHQLVLELIVNGMAQHYDSGLVYLESPTGAFPPLPTLSITVMAQPWSCAEFDLNIRAVLDPAVCYANCDFSSRTPTLNVADFTCFLERYSAGDPYANCDGSLKEPVLNIADFSCFLQRFASGCPK